MNAFSRNKLDGNHVRHVRRSLGLTQQEFATQLGVSKVTVARWESGTSRTCRGEYARRILDLGREQARDLLRTTTIFSVAPDSLARMDGAHAIEAFRDLLWCEARKKAGMSAADVDISCREIADGGIDARVANIPASSAGALVPGANYFQVKAGETAKPWQDSWIRRELFGNSRQSAVQRDRLGDGVLRCLNDRGRYVLACFGVDPAPEQIAHAEEKIAGYFGKCGFPDARVKVWAQQHLSGLFSAFPSLCLKLSGRNDLEFQSHSAWRLSDQMTRQLCLGDEQKQLIHDIGECLRGDEVRHVRLIGEPGLGKTRLLLEALSPDDLAPTVVYVPHAEDFQRSRLFNDLLRPDADYFLILVLDECTPRECASVWDVLRNRSDRCRVVSIDHDPYDTNDELIRVFECPPLPDEKTAEIIETYIGSQFDATRWAEFCSGSPRVAHAVGDNLRRSSEDLFKSPSTVPIWDRFVAGYDRLDSPDAQRKLTVLRHLALFERFGFEQPVQGEARFISDLVEKADPGITSGAFQSVIQELKRTRILQGKTTLFIVPKLLHIYLWCQFWEHHGRGLAMNELVARLPGQLSAWFIRMFPYAHASVVATQQVEYLLGRDGPFSDPQFVSSQIGSKFLNELAEASPDATLGCIERTIGQCDHPTLREFQQGRQHIVWALEKIAVYPTLFCRAAGVLLKLGEAENATHSNNASGTFAGLFCLAPGRTAPTGATPDQRLPALQAALESDSSASRRLGLKACATALSIHSGGRIIGPEYQGLRPTAQLWTPETWAEVHKAYGTVWTLLDKLRRTWGISSRAEANSVLVGAAGGLLQIKSLAETVLDTLDDLVDDEAADLKQVVELVTSSRRLRRERLAPAVVSRLAGLDDRITGTDFTTRVRRIVHLSGYHDQVEDPGRLDSTFNRRVSDLASEALADLGQFQIVLPELVRGTNNVVFQFGRELGRLDETRTVLPLVVTEYRTGKETASALLLSGYLASIFHRNPGQWEGVMATFFRDDDFVNLVGQLTRDSGFTDRAIEDLLREYDAGRLDLACLLSSGYWGGVRRLREENVHAIIERLLRAGEIPYALELVDFVYCAKEEPRTLPRQLILQVLSAPGKDSTGPQSNSDYHWNVVVEQLISQHPESQSDVFEIALERVCKHDWFLDAHNPAYAVVQRIIQRDPKGCWSMVASRLEALEDMERHRLAQWLGPGPSFGDDNIAGPLTLFPCDAVLEWIAVAPDERAPLIAHVVPQTLTQEEGGTLARELLNRYGDQERVRDSLFANFWSGGWSGSDADYYRGKRDTARKWLEAETSMRVRSWIDHYIDHLSHDIKRAEIDEERRF